MMNALNKLLDFAQAHGLLLAEDRAFGMNALLNALGLYAPPEDGCEEIAPPPPTVGPILDELCNFAIARGILEDTPYERERFGDHLVSLLLPPPSVIAQRFHSLYDRSGPAAATAWYYDFCRASNAIRVDSIQKNIGYSAPSPYGKLEITINLSKPEKDPREIARQRSMPSIGYPLCMLCLENEGYAGRPGYPSHETLRTVSLKLCGENWRMQYSPYSYYDEHCIVLNEQHIPMVIERKTFALLLDFVDQFPEYFLGSNADLPIVGGSILNHNHFQGGRHIFPLDRAPIIRRLRCKRFPAVRVGVVKWPMTCLEACCEDPQQLADFCDALLSYWRTYDDPQANILHETQGTPHNTLTPIARKEGDCYIMRIVLRNNRITQEHPLGIFHPHAELHHIKRENIGLIEVMGLFILPGRLRDELAGLKGYLTGEKPLARPTQEDPLFKHFDWISTLANSYGTALQEAEAEALLRQSLCDICTRVLEDAGVFKCTEAGRQALSACLQGFGLEPVEEESGK